MKRVTRVNPGFVLIAASAIALAMVACVEEGNDAPPLAGALGQVKTAAGGSGGMAGSAGSGGSSGSGGGGGQGGSAGGGQAGSATLPDGGTDAGDAG